MRRIIPLIVILAFVGVGAWWWSQRQAQAATEITGSGTIEAVTTNIGPQVPGRVVQVLASEGEAVQAGQVLFQ
jgi:multidrug resistance efflux pump